MSACVLLFVLCAKYAAHEAKDLRMEMEDVGTTGDGDNKPEAFQKQWEVNDILSYSVFTHAHICYFQPKTSFLIREFLIGDDESCEKLTLSLSL